MKKEKGEGFTWWDAVPIQEETRDQFDLEDILREFGGEGSPSGEKDDPALRSPVPLHITREVESAPLRYSPPADQFPRRQIPRRQTAPEQTMANSPTMPLPKLGQDKPGSVDGGTIRFAPVGNREVEESRPAEMVYGLEDEPDDLPVRRSSVAVAEREDEEKPDKCPENEPVPRTKRATGQKRKPERTKGDHSAPPPKRKPVITPESRYRTALEGMPGRSARRVVCTLLTLLALTLGVVGGQESLSGASTQRILVFGELALLILCAICCWDVLVSGILRLLRLRFDLNALVVFETLLGLTHGFICLQTGQASYCPVICLVLNFSLWGLQSRYRGTLDTMEVARRTDGTLALRREPNKSGDSGTILPGEGSMDAFLEEFDRTPAPQRLTEVYGLMLLILSLFGALLAPKEDGMTFIRNWTAILVSGTPLCGFLVWYRPWAFLATKLKEQGAAMYGWAGARRMSGKLTVPIADQDLFPAEGLKLNGVKFFGGASPGRVIAYGAAVMENVGGGLSALFQEQAEQRGCRRYTAQRVRRYDSGGIGADILSDSVLVGSLRFMQAMGVDMPAGTKVSQAVYVAIEGELVGVFAVQYGVSRSVAESMGMLCGCRGVNPTITALDFIITEPFVKSKFRVDTGKMNFLPVSQRSRWHGLEAGADSEPCALIWEYRFPTVAMVVTGARALRTAVLWGALIALVGGLMGMAIMTALTCLGAQETMSLVNIGLFQMIWAVPGILLSGWPRSI